MRTLEKFTIVIFGGLIGAGFLLTLVGAGVVEVPASNWTNESPRYASGTLFIGARVLPVCPENMKCTGEAFAGATVDTTPSTLEVKETAIWEDQLSGEAPLHATYNPQ